MQFYITEDHVDRPSQWFGNIETAFRYLCLYPNFTGIMGFNGRLPFTKFVNGHIINKFYLTTDSFRSGQIAYINDIQDFIETDINYNRHVITQLSLNQIRLCIASDSSYVRFAFGEPTAEIEYSVIYLTPSRQTSVPELVGWEREGF